MAITVRELAQNAKDAASELRQAGTAQKNRALQLMADALHRHRAAIIEANGRDIQNAAASGLSSALIDRLTLNDQRIDGIRTALGKLIALPDYVDSEDGAVKHPNGMRIAKRRVPLGLVGLIYESRPNVTVDSAALCLKSGNASLLRGGKEAIHSNVCLAGLIRDALVEAGLPRDSVCLIEDTDRSSAAEMMGLRGVLDVLIPRGGAGLIRSVVENARVPVIETGAGNCHIFVDAEADLPMAASIAANAKCSRPSVCNAAETLLVARSAAAVFLPMAAEAMKPYGVRFHGCPEARAILGDSVIPAAEEDWSREYGDFDLAVRVVSGLYEATAHIARYGTKHSECIVTKNYFTANCFVRRVDAAAVYVNASTRFTDGEEFGLGAEIGISTQKLHTRGPLGLRDLTTVQYVVEGNGQVR